jgi:hypothetical protein
MSKATGINRRGFLKIAFGAGGLLLVQSRLLWIVSAWLKGQSLLSLRLAALLRHKESARFVGLEYLTSYPQEADEHALLTLISSGFANGYELLDKAGNDEMRELLARKIRQDFEDEKVVKLQGWILSITEARLCALTTLV